MPINYGYNRDGVGALNLYGRPATGISRHVNGVGVDSNGNPYCVYTSTTVTTLRRAGLLWTVDGALVITYTDPGNTRLVNGFKVSAAGAVFVTTDTPTTTSSVTFDPILGSLMVSAAGAVHIQENWQSAPGSLTPNGFSLARATTGTYFDSAGLLQTAAINAARGTYRWNGSAWVFDGTLVEAAATNLVTDVRDMTTANWTRGATVTVAQTGTGADGAANSCSRVTGGATAATNRVSQQLVAAASQRVYGPLIKRVTGTGPILITQDGFTTTTDVSGQINSTTFTQVQIAGNTLNATYGVQVSTAGDVILVDGNQFEAGSNSTSTILTGGATRSADVLTASTSGLLANTQGFVVIGYRPIAYSNFPGFDAFLSAPNNVVLYNVTSAAPGTLGMYNGSVVHNSGLTLATIGTASKIAANWNGTTGVCAKDGVIGTPAAFGNYSLAATLYAGSFGAGAQQISMVLQSLRLGKKPATSAELSEFTA